VVIDRNVKNSFRTALPRARVYIKKEVSLSYKRISLTSKKVISQLNRMREEMKKACMQATEFVSYLFLGVVFLVPFVPMAVRKVQINYRQKKVNRRN
jgi:hypothetical protein